MPKSAKPKGAVPPAPRKKPAGPLWTGPNGPGPNGGVTQGLIGRYVACRERFRVYAMDGLRPADTFNSRLEFGSMWHCCEEDLAAGRPWSEALREYCEGLVKKYPMQQQEIAHWHDVAAALFPYYVSHWADHPDVKNRTPLLQEQTFDVPYGLPSGRRVRLRGKWDSVDLIDGHIWLQENKTKSAIDAGKIGRQVAFDLQTMTYLVALYEGKTGTAQIDYALPIRGVRYNVVRRSAHKSVGSMLKKVEEDIAAGRVGEWFSRWAITITPDDIEVFRRTCLDPILENIIDDYEWWTDVSRHGKRGGYDVWDYITRAEWGHTNRHHRLPYGVYNPVLEGGVGDLDEYLASGSTAGLRRTEVLYPELA